MTNGKRTKINNPLASSSFDGSKPPDDPHTTVQPSPRRIDFDAPPWNDMIPSIMAINPDIEQLEQRNLVFASELAETYTINRDALVSLLLRLHTVKLFAMRKCDLDFDTWFIERGLTPWKEARSKLVRLAKRFEDFNAALEDVFQDLVATYALSHVEPHAIDFLIEAMFKFEPIINNAIEIRGRTGNRGHPNWAIEAAHICRSFWYEQMHETPRSYFNGIKKPKKNERGKNRITAPGNAFSSWFCDIMKEIGNHSPSECDTLLRTALRSPINC